jgi:ribA/ribD-fused uncharacterized protein
MRPKRARGIPLELSASAFKGIPASLSTRKDPNMPIFFHLAKEEPYGVFCQWYIAKFTVTAESLDYLHRHKSFPLPDHLVFICAEQYMMHAKAMYFNDVESAAKILAETNPRKQKSLGRSVEGFLEEEWEKVREQVVEAGNWAKFKSNNYLRKLLLDTEDMLLCEASPYDRVWGIGFNADAARAMSKNREQWGLNLLGKALMKVRQQIRESLHNEGES